MAIFSGPTEGILHINTLFHQSHVVLKALKAQRKVGMVALHANFPCLVPYTYIRELNEASDSWFQTGLAAACVAIRRVNQKMELSLSRCFSPSLSSQ